MIVGRVIEIWRYPVKSMGGGRLERAELGVLGIPGDRGYALFDEEVGEVRGAKKMGALLRCSASYIEEPVGAAIPPAAIQFPDGSVVRSDDPGVSARVSALVGRKVTLHARRPAEDAEYYRRRLPEDADDFTRELRAVFGRLEDEPLPDLGMFPPELLEFTSPRGTYFDAFPVHLLSTGWLVDLERSNPRASFDRRRFRPNFLIEPVAGASGKPEQDWVGKQVRIGGALLAIEMPTVRCVMTTLQQGELPKDSTILRTIVRDHDQNLGVYASVAAPGTVAVGDSVEL